MVWIVLILGLFASLPHSASAAVFIFQIIGAIADKCVLLIRE